MPAGRAFRFTPNAIDACIQACVPIQTVSGDNFSAVLTEHGDVFAWFPFDDLSGFDDLHGFDDSRASQGYQRVEGGFQFTLMTVETPPILFMRPWIDGSPKRLVSLAAMDRYLVGITDDGLVFKSGDLSHPGNPVTFWFHVCETSFRILQC